MAVSEDNHSSLLAELDVLAPMEQPILIDSKVKSIEDLEDNLQFEVIGGRIPWKFFSEKSFFEFWPVLTKKCTTNAELNLIISNPISGPAFSLKESLIVNKNDENIDFSILNDLISKEQKWLNKQDQKNKFSKQMEELGWNISFEEWNEFVYLKVDISIINRWINKGSKYREIILKEYKEEKLIGLKKLFTRLDGKTIKQKILHTKFIAKNTN